MADIDGGRIAYEVTGHGPPVVLSHRIGDHRQVYRFLAPELAQAGYRPTRTCAGTASQHGLGINHPR